jgi:hypothetical protein
MNSPFKFSNKEIAGGPSIIDEVPRDSLCASCADVRDRCG